MLKKQFTLDDFVLIPAEKQPTAQVGSWKITGFREQTLRYLFKEIFVDSCYSCTPNTEEPFILDCGANIGFATFYFKDCWSNSTIHAFEPAPDTFSLLEKNVLANRLKNVHLHNIALGLNAGKTQLYCETDKQGSLRASTMAWRLPAEKTFAVTVPVEPVSKFIEDKIDILKIDVEGSEDKVIQELEASGKINQVMTAIIEYHWLPERDSELGVMKKILLGSGFHLTVLSGECKDGYQDILLFAERMRRP